MLVRPYACLSQWRHAGSPIPTYGTSGPRIEHFTANNPAFFARFEPELHHLNRHESSLSTRCGHTA